MTAKSYHGASQDLDRRSLAAEFHVVTKTKLEVVS